MNVTDAMVEAALGILFPLNHAYNEGAHERLKAKIRKALEAALAQQDGAVATGEVRAHRVNAGHGMSIEQYVIELGCDMDQNPIGRSMVGKRFSLVPIASSGPGGGGEGGNG